MAWRPAGPCLPAGGRSQPLASCAGRAPSPDNGAIHHRCLQERVCSGVVQCFLATSASLSPAPGLCQQEPEWSRPLPIYTVGMCRLHLWLNSACLQHSQSAVGYLSKGCSLLCSYCAVKLRIWLKPAKDGDFRANPLTFISMSSFMLAHKISQFSGTCTAMKVVPVLLWEELS